ncbi:MAG: hypothetical protein CTY38_01280 [Methylotenera sp.]|uniref:hypothetical protein n=1 Tax=Methylotenera sp. TaxID=2051956 RepID=UPI000D430DC8|nr:hypothetical protein [Methylotenera sp.]PPC84708.1 MAG: hypothetical protein CTY38_01280 [Methylotenera sp.]
MGEARKRGSFQARLQEAKRKGVTEVLISHPQSVQMDTNSATNVTMMEMVNETFDGNFDHQVETIH